ncbi:hypothetical protein [Paenibacillus sp. NAIST15-1]|uniref:hypothetical protein n=1 Tax=Paenibacillus sp. NAIST15-1 TaxID=1605994 RepID=UPI00086C8CD8|nr:hypothetical protein [Paenibacillus sp. NAIST15-1]GAV11322.1 tRNA/rRNA methyltransferase [Paenibacillus sp. NAIST15-1]
MKSWTRQGYRVVESELNFDLHQFEVIQDEKVIATIVPPDMESMEQIISDLDAGEDVNGWEDGMGNTIYIEKK